MPYSIIKYPLITEKAATLGSDNKYVFAVAVKSNKFQIREAVEKLYKVHVTGVSVMNVHPKKRRQRYREGYKSALKKAVVTLKEGDKIAVT